MRVRGKIRKLITGPMCSGKSEETIDALRKAEQHSKGNLRSAAFKPTTDSRSGPGLIESKADGNIKGKSIPAIEIPAKGDGPWQILERLKQIEAEKGPVDLIVVDEINFFPIESEFFDVVLRLLEKGYDLILSGLAYDYRDLPFGSTLLFAVMAEELVKKPAYCARCGADDATHSQRIHPDGTLARFNEAQEEVDDGTVCTYEPRCDRCFVVLDRPVPKY